MKNSALREYDIADKKERADVHVRIWDFLPDTSSGEKSKAGSVCGVLAWIPEVCLIILEENPRKWHQGGDQEAGAGPGVVSCLQGQRACGLVGGTLCPHVLPQAPS